MPALDEAHAALKDGARRFADDVIRPVAAELDREERFPAKITQIYEGTNQIQRSIIARELMRA